MKDFEKTKTEIENQSAQAKVPDDKTTQTEGEKQMRYGKFANAEALFVAYQNLEREFTKKSQKLKALEEANCDNSNCDEEDLPWYEEVVRVLPQEDTELDNCNSGSPTQVDESVDNPAMTNELLPQLAKDKDFLENYIFNNPEVTQEVLQRYITFLSKSDLPNTINSRGGAMSLTPPKRPKTIKEASLMAEKIFR